VTFPFEALRRRPDVEAPGLVAADAADRLLLDESHAARMAAARGEVVVIGDAYGALTLAARHDGADAVRVHQDALAGERALAANAADLGIDGGFRSLPLTRELVTGARVVLLRLPRSLDALRDVAGLIAAHAHPEVIVFAGGRIKHMSPAMNGVLRAHFATLDVTHARQKSRVLIARTPTAGGDPEPARAVVDGITVLAYGGAFAGARIDHGTRLLLSNLPANLPGGTVDDPLIDLACGTGVVATWLALQHPDAFVYATDQSAAAVASARGTVAANHVEERVRVVRDDALSAVREGTASFIALNPPFHSGAAVSDRLAPRLFADAARVLRPGGELWCVWNSPLGYRSALDRVVGPTRQVARDAKFTVTASVRR
jgi:16S rRNA (guanine1207-N2)-methyltransferase